MKHNEAVRRMALLCVAVMGVAHCTPTIGEHDIIVANLSPNTELSAAAILVNHRFGIITHVRPVSSDTYVYKESGADWLPSGWRWTEHSLDKFVYDPEFIVTNPGEVEVGLKSITRGKYCKTFYSDNPMARTCPENMGRHYWVYGTQKIRLEAARAYQFVCYAYMETGRIEGNVETGKITCESNVTSAGGIVRFIEGNSDDSRLYYPGSARINQSLRTPLVE